jgi:hypothetical protein
MKSALWSVFRIAVLAIVLMAFPGLKHSANACGETETEIDYYNTWGHFGPPCTPEGECAPRYLVGQQNWWCDGSYTSWGTTSSVSETHTDVCVECGPN